MTMRPVRCRVYDVGRWFEIVDGVEMARLDEHGVRMDVEGHVDVGVGAAMGTSVAEHNATMEEEVHILMKTPARYASSKATTSLEPEHPEPPPSMPSQDAEHLKPVASANPSSTAADASWTVPQ